MTSFDSLTQIISDDAVASTTTPAPIASAAQPALAGNKPFNVGMVWLSINAMQRLLDETSGDPMAELQDALSKHAGGDHGDLTDDEAYETPGRVRSSWGDSPEIETDLNRSVTWIS